MIKFLQFILLSLFPISLSAATFHALIATDTLTKDVRQSSKKDYKRMRKAISGIAKITKMSLKMKSLKDKKVTVEKVVEWVKNANVSKDDCLLFYYSGHGFSAHGGASRWPVMFYRPKKQFLSLEALEQVLLKKGARLTLILCDSCNNDPHRHARAVYTLGKAEHLAQKKGLTKLFVHTSGKIIASGAKPGGKSWGNEKGGFFTSSFLIGLQEECYKSKPSWKNVFEKSEKLLSEWQKPQYKLTIKE